MNSNLRPLAFAAAAIVVLAPSVTPTALLARGQDGLTPREQESSRAGRARTASTSGSPSSTTMPCCSRCSTRRRHAWRPSTRWTRPASSPSSAPCQALFPRQIGSSAVRCSGTRTRRSCGRSGRSPRSSRPVCCRPILRWRSRRSSRGRLSRFGRHRGRRPPEPGGATRGRGGAGVRDDVPSLYGSRLAGIRILVPRGAVLTPVPGTPAEDAATAGLITVKSDDLKGRRSVLQCPASGRCSCCCQRRSRRRSRSRRCG